MSVRGPEGGDGGDASGDERSVAVVEGVSCNKDCKYRAGSVVSGVLGLPSVLLRLVALSPLGVMEASVTCLDTEGDRELGKSGFGRLGDLELLQGDARSGCPGEAFVSGENSASRCLSTRLDLEVFWLANKGLGRPDGRSSRVPAPSLLPLELGIFRLGAGVMTGRALESSSESDAQGSKGAGSGMLPLSTGFRSCTFPSVFARRSRCAPFSGICRPLKATSSYSKLC